MPFKSEAQRRYLWANEPEIARDWADTYGSRIQAAHGGGIMQGGVKNYLGEQKEVTAPVKWQSSPDHPTTELAYITQAEKDLLVKQDLHNSLKGGVNRGPSGIMSLNGWGSTDPGQNVSGAAASAAESGRNTSDTLAAGMSHQDVKDFQAASVAAGAGQRVNPGFFDSRNTVSPEVLARAKTFAPQAYGKTRGGIGDFLSGGGFFGNLVRGLGQRFGLGKKYNEPTYDMSGSNKLGLGGIDPALLDNYSDAKIQKNSFLQDDQVSEEETINEDGDTYEEAISKGTFDGEKFQFDAVWGEQGEPG